MYYLTRDSQLPRRLPIDRREHIEVPIPAAHHTRIVDPSGAQESLELALGGDEAFFVAQVASPPVQLPEAHMFDAHGDEPIPTASAYEGHVHDLALGDFGGSKQVVVLPVVDGEAVVVVSAHRSNEPRVWRPRYFGHGATVEALDHLTRRIVRVDVRRGRDRKG